MEGVLLGNNLQIVLYDSCEAAELRLAIQLVKVASNWNPHPFPPTKKQKNIDIKNWQSLVAFHHITCVDCVLIPRGPG